MRAKARKRLPIVLAQIQQRSETLCAFGQAAEAAATG